MAKRYIDEAGRDEVDAVLEKADEIGVSFLCYPELVSALSRRRRADELNQAEYNSLKKRFERDLQDIGVIQLSPQVVLRSIQLFESIPLKTLDALHISCALEWNADLFVSGDEKQLAASQQSGFDIEFTGERSG